MNWRTVKAIACLITIVICFIFDKISEWKADQFSFPEIIILFWIIYTAILNLCQKDFYK